MEKKILGLNESEKRDLYLKKFYDNKLQGPMPQDMFISRPWVKYLLDEPLQSININDTIYNNYLNANKDNLDSLAMYFIENDTKFTHKEFICLVEKFSAILQELGIKENDTIGTMVNNSLEEPTSLMASSNIGAILKPIDFTKGPYAIKHSIEESKVKLLIIDEKLLPLEPLVNSLQVPVIVANSSMEKNERYLYFEELMKKETKTNVKKAKYVENKPVLTISSSGTTGLPKPITHSDKTINSAAAKMLYTNLGMSRENFITKVVPGHIGLGIITTLYTNLLVGTKIVFINGANPQEYIDNTTNFIKDFPKFISRNDFDKNSKLCLFAAPMFPRSINKNQKIESLEYMGGILAAGSRMIEEELNIIEESNKNKGCNVPVCIGYGQNEQMGAVSLNSNNYNVRGSAGYPTLGTEIRIVNPDTLEYLPIGENGKILERSSSEFLCYENMPKETNESRVTTSDGKVWFDPNDLGYFDNNGNLFVTGRTSRSIIRYDFKISIDSIEGKIKCHSLVKDCGVLPILDGYEEAPIAFITLNEQSKKEGQQIIEEIQKTNNSLADLEIPVEVIILEEMPYLSSGKIDYMSLSKIVKQIEEEKHSKKLK